MHGGYIYSNPSAVAISIVKSVWDACSLKGQLEKTRIWKFLSSKWNRKNEIRKFEPKLEKSLLLNTALKTFQLKM